MKTRFKCAFLIMTAVASFQPGDALALGPAAPDKVKWESDYDKAVERALSDGKGIMVWVRESPCRICASLKELRMRKYLATKGNAFRPVVPMKIEQEELSLPLSDRKILALRPLVYANSQDYHRVIYLDNHSRRRMSGPLVTFVGSLIVHPDHASRFCATWLEQVDRAEQRGFVAVDGQAWGRSTAIKARNGVLDDLVKQPAALVGEIAVDEDPAVLLHLLQKIKTASEPGAEVVWRRILLDGNSFVQRAGLASLLRIRKGGVELACEILGPELEAGALDLWEKWVREDPAPTGEAPPPGPFVHPYAARDLVEEICERGERDHALLVGTYIQARMGRDNLETVIGSYFGKAVCKVRHKDEAARKLAGALLRAVRWSSYSGTIMEVTESGRLFARKVYGLLEGLGFETSLTDESHMTSEQYRLAWIELDRQWRASP